MNKLDQHITAYLFSLEELVEDVRKEIGFPTNFWAVAATIESFGIRDEDALEEYGFKDVFTLAQYVFKQLRKYYEKRVGHVETREIEKDVLSFKKKLEDVFKHYFTGLLFALPMLIQIASVLLFDYGLWAWVRFNTLQATMVAIATIVSFIITGGYVQVLGFQLTYYKAMENYQSAYDMAWYLLKRGFKVSVVVGLGMFAVNFFLGLFPVMAVFVATIYLILLSALLLASGILYALEFKLPIVVGILFGTLMVIVSMEVFHLGIYLSHWIGIFFAVLINLISGYVYFQVKLDKMPAEFRLSRLPKQEVILYMSYRYFVYGTVFFLFLFIDRIMAWSSGFPGTPYIIWFNTPYELGMDWALIPLLTTMALLDYSVHRFSNEIIPKQKEVIFENYQEFNRYFKRFYHRQILYVVGIGLLSIIGAYYFVKMFEPIALKYPNVAIFYSNPITEKTFWLGSIGYIILCVGLLNSLFFFTLFRPAFAMNAMVLGITANIYVGFILSRSVSYEYAVVGLIAGATVFALVSAIWANRVFKKLDYYYFAAF
ncbi:MAG: hypothetical protein Kow00108_14620 [Calditrichia bacterium]